MSCQTRAGSESRTVVEVVRRLMDVMSLMVAEEDGATMAHQLLEDRLRGTYGVEVEKVLLVSLRELSRFFNDTAVVDQYQAQVTAYLTTLLVQEGREIVYIYFYH